MAAKGNVRKGRANGRGFIWEGPDASTPHIATDLQLRIAERHDRYGDNRMPDYAKF